MLKTLQYHGSIVSSCPEQMKAMLAQRSQTGSVRSYVTKNIKPLKMISFNK